LPGLRGPSTSDLPFNWNLYREAFNESGKKASCIGILMLADGSKGFEGSEWALCSL
jgi:hypothetical protein